MAMKPLQGTFPRHYMICAGRSLNDLRCSSLFSLLIRGGHLIDRLQNMTGQLSLRQCQKARHRFY
jgi:hypothetical protein